MNRKCPYCGHTFTFLTEEKDCAVYNIIALMGPSGSGKDTIMKRLAQLTDYNIIRNITTRPKRENETDEYHFVSEDVFLYLDAREKLIEHTRFRDWLYGTEYSALREWGWNVGVFSPDAIRQIGQKKDINLLIFYIEASDKVRMIRSLNRESAPDVGEICRRFQADAIDFAKNKLNFEYTIIPNNNLEELNHGVQAILGMTR